MAKRTPITNFKFSKNIIKKSSIFYSSKKISSTTIKIVKDKGQRIIANSPHHKFILENTNTIGTANNITEIIIPATTKKEL